MIGITIRMGALRNDLTTPGGETYELGTAKEVNTISEGVQKYLKSLNYFAKREEKSPKGA